MKRKEAQELSRWVHHILWEALYGKSGAYRTKDGQIKWHRAEKDIQDKIDKMVSSKNWFLRAVDLVTCVLPKRP